MLEPNGSNDRSIVSIVGIALVALTVGSVAWSGAAAVPGVAVAQPGAEAGDEEAEATREKVRGELERAVARLEAALEELRAGELEVAQGAVEDALEELRELELEPMAFRLHRARELGDRIRERVRRDIRERWTPRRGELSFAAPGDLGFGRAGWIGDGFLTAWTDELELTDEQLERVEEIRDRHRREAIRRRADVEMAELDLEDLEEEADVDLDAVEAAMRKLADLKVEAKLSRLRMREEIHAVLTPEQEEHLEELRQERRGFFFRSGDGPAVRWRGPESGFHWRSRGDCREDDR